MASNELNAVVTGGGSGLGRELVLEIARRGGRAVIADLELSRAESVAAEVELLAGPGKAFPIACDVRRVEEVERVADFAGENLGQVSLVVNNAGVAVGGLIGEVPLEDWHWVADVNLWGVIHGCHVFLPRLKAQGSGHFLNVASAAGLLTPPELGPYNVMKAAVVALSETLYSEAKPHGVGVTVLCPTFFKTRLLETARGGDPESMNFVSWMMNRSRVQAGDVAKAALDSVRRGDLHCVPMVDGKTLWALKRAFPMRFFDLLARYAPRLRKRANSSAESEIRTQVS